MERVSSQGLAAASVRACAGFTSREIQILRNLALGKSDREISVDLMISVKTVNHHVGNIMQKLDARKRTHAVAKALVARQIEMRASDASPILFGRRRCDKREAILTQRTVKHTLDDVEIQPCICKAETPWPTGETLIKPETKI